MCGDIMKKKFSLEYSRKLSVISVTVFLYALYINRIIPYRYALMIAIVFLLTFFMTLFKKSRILNIAFIILVLFLSIGLFYSQSIFYRVFNNERFETEKISFISLVKNQITIDKIDPTTVFGLSDSFDDQNKNHINNHLSEHFDFTSDIVLSESHLDTIQGLYDGIYQIGIIDNAVTDTILESYPDFQLDFEILWSIEREIRRDEIVKDVDTDTNSFIVLISGIDINGPISLRSRSDVNIVAVINPDNKTISLVSIPRDMYVPFACKNDALDKLTHSGIYGVNCTVQTIEEFLDIDINYYLRLNFTSFIKIIDVIGDIRVYSEYTFSSGGYRFESGMNILNSQSALAFVRERKSFEAGDIQRGLNQQEVIKGIINKIVSQSSLTRMDQIVNSIAKSFDTNMGAQNIQKLIALQIDRGISWEFNSYFVNGTESMQKTYSMPGRYLFVIIPSQESVNEIKLKIRDALK